MGGVNTNRNYVETMGIGKWDPVLQQVDISKPTLQGGIVRFYPQPSYESLSDEARLPFTIFPVPSQALF